MRKVTIVLPVLITSCHVSLYWNIGPVVAHTITMKTALRKVAGFPETSAVWTASLPNQSPRLDG
jgi:hypothetical protein